MLKIILIAAVVILVVFVVVVLLQPADFRIVRSATIAAPPDVVFAQVNDFHRWAAWSPWEKLDPDMKRTYSGPPAGTGAGYAWTGNKKVGAGRMTLTESHPDDRIGIALEFLEPYAATNTLEFTFVAAGSQTKVTWNMAGRNGFVSKAFCLFMNLDKTVGGDFERGLANLKSVSEAAAGSPGRPG